MELESDKRIVIMGGYYRKKNDEEEDFGFTVIASELASEGKIEEARQLFDEARKRFLTSREGNKLLYFKRLVKLRNVVIIPFIGQISSISI